MSGFIRDPLGDIQLIADNLRDRYKSGFPILKEIVQNADDAKANSLCIGWHQGLKEAEHPLLRDPAMFFINDAYLSEDDARGIRSIGLGTKADNKNAVGKFGLGMKSLFHLGELYFFIGSDWQNSSGEYSKADVLNPWSDSRSEWEKFSDNDKLLLQKTVQYITPEFDESGYAFIVWVPLRSKTISNARDENYNYIINSDDYGYEVPTFITDADLPVRLGKLLPMLKQLKSITGYEVSDKSSKQLFSIKLDAEAQRISFPNLIGESNWSGSILISAANQNKTHALNYHGTEVLLETDKFKSIKNHNNWPTSYTRDKTGAEKQIQDKARPHAATVILAQPADGQAKLIVQWAVFLPLGEQDTSQSRQVFEIDIDGNMSFDLFMHGYFFIDAGRIGIHGRQYIGSVDALDLSSEEAATQEWNRLLANEGTLSRILSSVDFIASSLRLKKEQILALSKGLSRYLEIEDNRRYIKHVTAEYQWVYQVTPEQHAWALISSQQPTRPLPSVPVSSNGSEIWEAIPGLIESSSKWVLIKQEKPNIKVNKNSVWKSEELAHLLQSVTNSTFESQKLLTYLNRFLTSASVQISFEGIYQNALISLARKVLKEVPLLGLSRNQSAVKAFLSLIKSTYRLAFRLDKDDQDVWDVIADIETEHFVIVPSFLEPTDVPSSGNLAFNVADKLLKNIAKSFLEADSLEKITLDLLSSLSSDIKDELIKKHDNIPLFRVYAPNNQKPYLESSRKLRELFQSRLLFRLGEPGERRFNLGQYLKQALLNQEIVFINEAINKELFGGRVSQCNTKFVLHLLSKRPELAEPEKRIELISKLDSESFTNNEDLLSVRYLLHGSKLDSDITVDLWSGGSDEPVWSALLRDTLSVDRAWTIIPYVISNTLKLSSKEKSQIKLKEVSHRDVLERVGEDIKYIDFTKFVETQEDAEEILRHIDEHDAWKDLQLHKTTKGKFTSINENCALKSSYPLPSALSEKVVWIEPAKTRAVQKQQRDFLTEVNAQKAIELALAQAEPSNFESFIFDTLGKADLSPIKEQLKTSAWLNVEGRSTSPNQIIAAQSDDWPQSYALSKKTGQLYFSEDLSLSKHPNFSNLKDLLLSDSAEIIEKVISVAAENSDYTLGLSTVNTAVLKQAANFSDTVANLDGWELVIELYKNNDSTDLDIHLLSKLTGPVNDLAKLVEAYSAVAEVKALPDKTSDLRRFLLAEICHAKPEMDILRGLKLRTQKDSYELADKLCYDVIGAASDSLLHMDDWRIVRNIIPIAEYNIEQASLPSGLANNTNCERTAAELNRYFSLWEPHVSNKLAIATTLALMSGTQGVAHECEPYLGQHSLIKLLEDIGSGWKVRSSTRDNPVPFADKTFSQAVNEMQFSVSCFEGDKAVVQSLFSEEIEIELESDYQTIFIWESYSFANTTTLGLLLRKLPVAELSEERLLDVLKNSAELLLEKVYGQRLLLDSIWDKFSGAEQLDITVAKITMLDGIIYHLKELRLKDAGILSLIKEYDKNNIIAAENGSRDTTEKNIVIDKISNEVESRQDLQQEILSAIRDKIEQAQYRPQSIPFELFQNADDAVIELGKLGVSQDEMDQRSLFRVRSNQNTLSFMNWGREVNQYRVTSSSIDGSDFGFKTDLQKMIARNQSNKDDKTTGKFGLGFKSCLLVTDTPHIVSGRLAVQIDGGLLPNKSTQQDKLFQEARDAANRKSDNILLKPSIIALPLKEGVSSEQVLDFFIKQAGLMTVFAKQIRTIDIDGQHYQWQPKFSKKIPGLSFGTVQVATKKRTTEINIASVKTSSGNFVFRLGSKGFHSLGVVVPKLWHLAPLLGESKLGFAINAAFDVDIGRNQLAISSSKNKVLFSKLGQELSYFLKQLFKVCEESWTAVRDEFGFDESTDIAELWISIWAVLQTGISSSQGNSEIEVGSHDDLIMHMFTTEAGIMAFYNEHKAFPAGLSGANPKLITVTKVTHRASELLTNISEHMAKLQLLDNYFKSESLVSYSTGRSLLDLNFEIPTLELESLLEDTLDDNYLSPSQAGQLYSVLDDKFDTLLSKQRATHEQVEQFKSKLSYITVLTKNGTHRAIKETLLQHSQQGRDDEKLVVSFAPENVIASAQYNQQALSFITKCRRETVPYNLDKLFIWITSKESAESVDKQKAICSYIVDGQYGQELAEKAKATCSPHWLFSINVQHLKQWLWNDSKIDLFRNVRMVTKREQQQRVGLQLKTEGQTSLSHTDALNKIYEWWIEEGDERLSLYEKELYPGGSFDWNSIREDKEPELYKQAWLKLLFLGSCQTIGRARDVQHRAALELFENKGWWDVFVNSEDSAAWFNVMDQYLSSAIADDKYRTWLQILPLYRFSSYLDDYIDLFWSAESQLPNIKDLIQPGSSAKLSGSGFAPPELKSTLGIGANFILRELYRHDVYRDKSIEQHCFVASKGIRELLSRELSSGLSFDIISAESSKLIYDFLCDNLGEEKATFNGAFDIPLRILARSENTELLADILQIGAWS